MQLCGLKDMKYSGWFFTWNNKQCGEKRVLEKLKEFFVMISGMIVTLGLKLCFSLREHLIIPLSSFDFFL